MDKVNWVKETKKVKITKPKDPYSLSKYRRVSAKSVKQASKPKSTKLLWPFGSKKRKSRSKIRLF